MTQWERDRLTATMLSLEEQVAASRQELRDLELTHEDEVKCLHRQQNEEIVEWENRDWVLQDQLEEVQALLKVEVLREESIKWSEKKTWQT